MPSFENLTDQLSIFRMQQLSSTEKLVAVALLSFRNTETGRCNPPICSDDPEKETICTRTGLKKRCVVNTIASLQEKGVISCVKRQNKPSDVTFTVHQMHSAPNAPCTKCTAAVHDVHPHRAFNAPITDKEQIKNRQEYFSSLTTSKAEALTENGIVYEPDLFGGENSGPNYADHTPAPKSAETSVRTTSAKADPVPYAKIVALYNEKCAARLPKAMAPSDRLKSEIRGRWKDIRDMTGAKTEEQTLAEFGKFFEMVSKSDWLCDPSSGWGKANLPWLLQRRKFELAMNGTYQNKTHTTHHRRFEEIDYSKGINDDNSF